MTVKDVYYFIEYCLDNSLLSDIINIDVMAERKQKPYSLRFYGYKVYILTNNISFTVRHIYIEDMVNHLYENEYQIDSIQSDFNTKLDELLLLIRDIKMQNYLL